MVSIRLKSFLKQQDIFDSPFGFFFTGDKKYLWKHLISLLKLA